MHSAHHEQLSKPKLWHPKNLLMKSQLNTLGWPKFVKILFFKFPVICSKFLQIFSEYFISCSKFSLKCYIKFSKTNSKFSKFRIFYKIILILLKKFPNFHKMSSKNAHIICFQNFHYYFLRNYLNFFFKSAGNFPKNFAKGFT